MALRNLIGDSTLAIPLSAQGIQFGVLSFLNERPRAEHEWNQRLAEGLAQEAAQAISHTRLHEAAQQKQQELVTRLRQLEHLAEALAHDLKGPGARMEELARLLVQQDSGQFDDRTKRWLSSYRREWKRSCTASGRNLDSRSRGCGSRRRHGYRSNCGYSSGIGCPS